MRVLIIEDQILFCDFLKDFLINDLGMTIVGVTLDGPGALKLISTTRPDLVILDILIPKLSGILVAKAIRDELPHVKILGLSAACNLKTIHQVQELGFARFIDKSEATKQLLKDGIEAIKKGERFYSESIQVALEKMQRDPKAFQKILTKREQEILTLIGGGRSDKDIGKLLGVSPASVQSHRKSLFKKLDVHNTPGLIQLAQEYGFWRPEFDSMELTQTYSFARLAKSVPPSKK